MASRQGNTALAFARTWHHVSAADRTLGTLASRIAWVLMGKHKPVYDPAVDAGDYVLVTSPRAVHLSGRKASDKVYRSHTGFMGGLKEVPIGTMRERRADQILRKAVSGMLPKNKHRDPRLARLKIYDGPVEELERAAAAGGGGGGVGQGGARAGQRGLEREVAWWGNVRRVVRD